MVRLEKTSKFGALIGLTALSAMAMVFALDLPVLMESVSGQIFAGTWAIFAILAFVAHYLRFTTGRVQFGFKMPLPAVSKKDARTRKKIRGVRAMRG